jgi:hypothetical protein
MPTKAELMAENARLRELIASIDHPLRGRPGRRCAPGDRT